MKPMSRLVRSRPGRVAFAILVATTLAASLATEARAHGPTIRVGYSGVRPAQLGIAAGTTVHFLNANAGQGVCTVVADDGSFESPPMARGEGWHFEFDRPGRYVFHVKEYTSAAGVIVVGPSKDD
jgi:plastocyanin